MSIDCKILEFKVSWKCPYHHTLPLFNNVVLLSCILPHLTQLLMSIVDDYLTSITKKVIKKRID